jgi:CarD family transcriptional regulator
MQFQIGEKVVYPNQGVGTVEDIGMRAFGSASEKFYLVRFGFNSTRVLVPISSAAHIGLRPVQKHREISRMLSFLAHGACAIDSDWKRRYRTNTEKMQSGDLLKAAEIVKTLLQLQVEKPLSFRERKMLDRAVHMLLSEVAIARKLPEVQAFRLLADSLAAAGLTLAPIES